MVIVDLAPGETLRAHPGHVGMFQERVSFDITTLMKGISNSAIFGGDGLFLAALTGPGRVWLQTLPLPEPGPRPGSLSALQGKAGDRPARP